MEQRWRKLTWEEVRQVLRAGFAELHTLPDRVLTDKEKCIQVRLDPHSRQWCFLERDDQGLEHELNRRPLIGII